MTRSMTAFARGDEQTSLGNYSWEIRSVNSRYLEPHFRLPETLRAIETDLREALRTTLQRGKVECSLKFTPSQLSDDISVNEEAVRKLNHAADQVHAIIGPGNALSALDVLAWPGVLEQPQMDMSQVKDEALTLFKHTLDELIAMRSREGEALNGFISQRLDAMEEQVATVKSVLPDLLKQQRTNLLTRFEDLKVNLDAERLEQEMVILVQKADVDEELDRLEAHFKEVRRILKQKGSIGRRLDFMMQELNREANTLSSKSLSSVTTQSAVEMKVLIEQMREQVQNIE